MSSSNLNSLVREIRYDEMEKHELERLAVAAILEHRNILVADEAIYDEWTRAHADPSIQTCVVKSLQEEYVARQRVSEEKQKSLCEIIDALGYVPDVPLEGFAD